MQFRKPFISLIDTVLDVLSIFHLVNNYFIDFSICTNLLFFAYKSSLIFFGNISNTGSIPLSVHQGRDKVGMYYYTRCTCTCRTCTNSCHISSIVVIQIKYMQQVIYGYKSWFLHPSHVCMRRFNTLNDTICWQTTIHIIIKSAQLSIFQI